MNTRFINATVLTMENEDIMKNCEVFVEYNVISYVVPYIETFKA